MAILKPRAGRTAGTKLCLAVFISPGAKKTGNASKSTASGFDAGDRRHYVRRS